jgi:hypothetical protein
MATAAMSALDNTIISKLARGSQYLDKTCNVLRRYVER